jgi:hypothetical protein
MKAPEENTAMLRKMTLALALMIAALATMAPAGPGDGQGSFSHGDNTTGGASGGGNLVPLW